MRTLRLIRLTAVVTALCAALCLGGCSDAPGQAEEQTYPLSGDFENIRIESLASSVQFQATDEGTCRIEFSGDSRLEHSVRIEDDTLVVVESAKKLPVNLRASRLTVYLSRPEYEDLEFTGDAASIDVTLDFSFDDATLSSDAGEIAIRGQVRGDLTATTEAGQIMLGRCTPETARLKTDSGNILLHATAVRDALSLETDVGTVHISYTRCGSLEAKNSIGDITLDNVLCEEAMDVAGNVGSITLVSCDAASMRFETDTGDITGTVLTPKVFTAKSNAGTVNVPNTTEGGECSLKTDMGRIDISIASDEA